jgi:uncharacterized membrane protein
MKTTNRTTRIAGLLLALLIAAILNGALLWKFDTVAREATLAQAAPTTHAAAINPPRNS